MANPSNPSFGRRMVYYAFLAAPLIYLLLIYELAYIVEWEPVFPDTFMTYYLVACALICAVVSKPMRNHVWNKRKATVRTPGEFEPAYFGVSMISIAFAESAGVFGLLIYMLTGEFIWPVVLNVIAFIAVAANIPRQAEIDEKRKEMHFTS